MFSTLFFCLDPRNCWTLRNGARRGFGGVESSCVGQTPGVSLIHPQEIFSHSIWRGPVPARCLLFTASYFIATATNLLLPQPTGNVLVAKFSRLNLQFLALKSQSLSGSLTDDVILNVLGFFFPFPLSQTNSFLACLTLTPILHEPYLSMLQHFPWLPRITKSWAVAAR